MKIKRFTYDEWLDITQKTPFVREKIRGLFNLEQTQELREFFNHSENQNSKLFMGGSNYYELSPPVWAQDLVFKKMSKIGIENNFPDMVLEHVAITSMGVEDYLAWHCDTAKIKDYKLWPNVEPWTLLTISVNLISPSKYNGGVFQIADGFLVSNINLHEGDAICVNSNYRNPHRVTKVTEGTRIQLVAWTIPKGLSGVRAEIKLPDGSAHISSLGFCER